MTAPGMSLQISRILHAGYIFECEQVKIAFDPIFENPFSRNCYAFPHVEFDHEQIRKLELSAIFISHFHDDHCSMESLDFLDRKTPIYIYCAFDELFSMLKELGFVHVHRLETDSPVSIGPYVITPRRALDWEVDSMFQIQAANLNVLNLVDSWMAPSTLEALAPLAPWDLVLWPFQALREMAVLSPTRADPAPEQLPQDWMEQLNILRPKFIVPSSCQFIHESWSWYNQALFPISYQQFENEILSGLSDTKVIRLNPSVSIVLEKQGLKEGPPLPWIQPIGEQNVDYSMNADVSVTPTSEISKHFPSLTVAQTKRVFEYCQSGLLEKYQRLQPSESYFQKPRFWRLSLYDDKGEVTHFCYRLKDQEIELVSQDEGEALAWTTELPLFKLLMALENGETLTSMYMRVNAMRFDEAIEREIQFVDPIEDPLIRCLFNGEFGAYQRAQLEKILNRKS